MPRIKKQLQHLEKIRALPRKQVDRVADTENVEQYQNANVNLRILNRRDSVQENSNLLNVSEEKNDSNYIIIDLKILNELFSVTKCGKCNEYSLEVEIDNNKFGFTHKLNLICTYCKKAGEEYNKKSPFTSRRIVSITKIHIQIVYTENLFFF